MKESINRIASEFLARYLHENPQAKLQRVYPVIKTLCCTDADEAAHAFVQQVQNETTERIEINDEPTHVYILRICPRNLPAYLAGIRGQRLVWTYHPHLSSVLQRDDAERISKQLTERGIQTFFLPAK